VRKLLLWYRDRPLLDSPLKVLKRAMVNNAPPTGATFPLPPPPPH
jgi:hypothetical protein